MSEEGGAPNLCLHVLLACGKMKSGDQSSQGLCTLRLVPSFPALSGVYKTTQFRYPCPHNLEDME